MRKVAVAAVISVIACLGLAAPASAQRITFQDLIGSSPGGESTVRCVGVTPSGHVVEVPMRVCEAQAAH